MAKPTDPLSLLRDTDLRRLLAMDPRDLIGRILQLNRLPRYHNQLDALSLIFQIAQLRTRQLPCQDRRDVK